jgi:hypothetical protein
MTPLRLLGGVLVFAGLALLAGATVSTVDWALCLAGGGGQGCRQSKGDALQAWTGAANVALGIAIQSRPQP